MDEVESRSTFEHIWALSAKLESAVRRCEEIARGEAAMGYVESAQEYTELFRELRVVKAWYHEMLLAELRVS